MANSKQAICIIEICDPLALKQEFGDRKAANLIKSTLTEVEELIKGNGGSVVKAVGEAVMASFLQPEVALSATRGVRELASRLDRSQETSVRSSLRAGLHWGDVISHGGDLFGEAVNLAAQLTSLAKPGQILTTSDTLESFGPSRGVNLRFLSHLPVKGREKQLDIYEVLWVEGQRTIQNPNALAAGAQSGPKLRLSLGRREIEAGPRRTTVTMGRGAQNDLVVQGAWISRMHARIDLRGREFVISDQSTNGTYVLIPGQPPAYLKVDELTLCGSGAISLGEQFTEGDPKTIRFSVEDYP